MSCLLLLCTQLVSLLIFGILIISYLEKSEMQRPEPGQTADSPLSPSLHSPSLRPDKKFQNGASSSSTSIPRGICTSLLPTWSTSMISSSLFLPSPLSLPCPSMHKYVDHLTVDLYARLLVPGIRETGTCFCLLFPQWHPIHSRTSTDAC